MERCLEHGTLSVKQERQGVPRVPEGLSQRAAHCPELGTAVTDTA